MLAVVPVVLLVLAGQEVGEVVALALEKPDEVVGTVVSLLEHQLGVIHLLLSGHHLCRWRGTGEAQPRWQHPSDLHKSNKGRVPLLPSTPTRDSCRSTPQGHSADSPTSRACNLLCWAQPSVCVYMSVCGGKGAGRLPVGLESQLYPCWSCNFSEPQLLPLLHRLGSEVS